MTAIDRGAIGTELPELSLHVDAGRLRYFAKAIGETDPVYTDLDAAKEAGHPDPPVPPTFIFGIALHEETRSLSQHSTGSADRPQTRSPSPPSSNSAEPRYVC